MKTYTAVINHNAISQLPLSDQIALRDEIENQINETEFKFGPGDQNDAVSEHRDQVIDQLSHVLHQLDIHIAKKLNEYFTIQMPNGSDALLHRPKQKKAELIS
ncbi:hypothetical protein GCM10028806_16210 [Spirosoma terrae]|uniref:Uncharacterized protein n=1 Tax=Spirosoma terrae TaxID=1968276 RepID=A0A6L9LF04_9BACT|nr:hypothetical protein [Spirosoma terrae]NDU95269.1 hypothetical protein [Spirosoma terrae]